LNPAEHDDPSWLLRLPELRMIDVTYGPLVLEGTTPRVIDLPGRSCFYHLRHGSARLVIDGVAGPAIKLAAGASIALHDGRSHRWQTDEGSTTCELIGGSLDRRHTALPDHTVHPLMLLPADAQPYAEIVRHSIEVMALDLQRPRCNDAIGRRCAEIIGLAMLQYMQSQLNEVGDIPPAVRQDVPLLRAWTAFLADPAKPWTVASLAQAACISRTAFANRFGKVTGATPLATLRWLRIRYAADMLRNTRAPLADIALKVGYGSEVALMRAFRREMGTTPTRFRAEAMRLGIDR
jgi:AraC-like DNA-binding protein